MSATEDHILNTAIKPAWLNHISDYCLNLPYIGPLSIYVADRLGLAHAASFIAICLTVAVIILVPYLLYGIYTAYYYITHFTTKGSGIRARFATLKEIFQEYMIPTEFTVFLGVTVYSCIILFMLSVYLNGVLWDGRVPFWLIVLLSINVSAFMQVLRPYKTMRQDIQPFPLGKYNLFNIYLTGGKRHSLFRGEIAYQREAHVNVIGPSGCGKTTKIFIPGLLQDAFNNCSAVMIEAKASEQEDLFSVIAPTWAAQNKKVILFDPWGDNSVSFNPLLNLKPSFDDPDTRDTIEDVVNAIYGTYETEKGQISGDASYHSLNEQQLLKGLMLLSLFKPKGQRNLAAISQVVRGTVEGVCQYINDSVNLSLEGQQVGKFINEYLLWFVDLDNGNIRDKAMMLQGLSGKLNVFSHPRVKRCVIKDELDMDIIFKEPTLFCIKSPLTTEGASTISSIIVRLLCKKVPKKNGIFTEDAQNNVRAAEEKYIALNTAGSDQKKRDGRQKADPDNNALKEANDALIAAQTALKKRENESHMFKVYFYLDELPSLSIPKFDQFMKTARSAGVGVISAIQDKPDLAIVLKTAPLGIQSVDAILANYKTVILLPGVQFTTAEYYSKKFGKVEYKQSRTIRNALNPLDYGSVEQRMERLIMTPDDIIYIPNDKCVITDQNTRPFLANSVYWNDNPFLKKVVKNNAHIAVPIFKKASEDITFQSPEIKHNLTSKEKVKRENEKFESLNNTKNAEATFQPDDSAYRNAQSGGGPNNDSISGGEDTDDTMEINSMVGNY